MPMMYLPCRLRALHTRCPTCRHFTTNFWRSWTFHSSNIALFFLWSWYYIIFTAITCLCRSLTSQTASYLTINISFCWHGSCWTPFCSCTPCLYFIPAPWALPAHGPTWWYHPPHQLAALPCLCHTCHHSRERGRPATHKDVLPGRREAMQQHAPAALPGWKSPGGIWRRWSSRNHIPTIGCSRHAPELRAGIGKRERHPGRAADHEQPSLRHRPSPDPAGGITGTAAGGAWHPTSVVPGPTPAHPAHGHIKWGHHRGDFNWGHPTRGVWRKGTLQTCPYCLCHSISLSDTGCDKPDCLCFFLLVYFLLVNSCIY